MQPEKVRDKDFIAQIRALKPDVLALAAFGQIIPRALLEIPPLGPINLHGSLLPAYRGAAPIQYALLNGEKKTGVTTMWMAPELDAGDILLQSSIEIRSDEDAGELTLRLSHLGAELLVQTLYLLEKGGCPRVVQDHTKATFAPSITPADCIISWEESSERCCNRIRALSPRPGAIASFRQKKVKIWRASWQETSAQGDPGKIEQVQSSDVLVTTGLGALTLLEVQPENSRRMSAGDWARGARIVPGDKFDLMVLES
jgi:methionyl-tRNA formyltransferase